MERDHRRGYLELIRPAAPFTSPLRLLSDSFRLFGSHFGFIAAVTLLVYAPGHLLYQLAASVLEVPSTGVLSIVALNVVDLALSSLAIPAIVYGLLREPAVWPALGWGRRQWMRMLRQQLLVDVTVILYGTLLIVPGLVAAVRLAFVPVVIAVEGDHAAQPLERSRELAKGRMWRIVGVLLPLAVLDGAANYLLLGRIGGIDNARMLFILAECGIAIISQVSTVAALLMYAGAVETLQKKTAKL
jgi:hypothetical protein